MTRFFALFAFVTASCAFGQMPEIEWQANCGGAVNDLAQAVIPTSDGAYFAGGSHDAAVKCVLRTSDVKSRISVGFFHQEFTCDVLETRPFARPNSLNTRP